MSDGVREGTPLSKGGGVKIARSHTTSIGEVRYIRKILGSVRPMDLQFWGLVLVKIDKSLKHSPNIGERATDRLSNVDSPSVECDTFAKSGGTCDRAICNFGDWFCKKLPKVSYISQIWWRVRPSDLQMLLLHRWGTPILTNVSHFWDVLPAERKRVRSSSLWVGGIGGPPGRL